MEKYVCTIDKSATFSSVCFSKRKNQDMKLLLHTNFFLLEQFIAMTRVRNLVFLIVIKAYLMIGFKLLIEK